jgi:NTP pyrophosphatase (non-canonical NTP hydrolase)
MSQKTCKTISNWVQNCHLAAREKGFWDKDRNVGEMLMLIVSELGEAIEAHRKEIFGLGKKDTFEDELADTAIRLFDLCGGLGIDLEKQMRWKMEFNKSRKKRHGKAY